MPNFAMFSTFNDYINAPSHKLEYSTNDSGNNNYHEEGVQQTRVGQAIDGLGRPLMD